MNDSYLVIFEVLVFEEVTENSEIKIGERYVGNYFPHENEIKYITNEDRELIFIPDADCEIIEQF